MSFDQTLPEMPKIWPTDRKPPDRGPADEARLWRGAARIEVCPPSAPRPDPMRLAPDPDGLHRLNRELIDAYDRERAGAESASMESEIARLEARTAEIIRQRRERTLGPMRQQAEEAALRARKLLGDE